MVDVLTMVLALCLGIGIGFLLLFLISSLREGERRAATVAGILMATLAVMEVGLFWLGRMGSLSGVPGVSFLGLTVAALGGGLYGLLKRTASNPRALQGTKGYRVGEVSRFDEREELFARNRSLPAESEPYQAFYRAHPDWETPDARRRERGGPLGIPGAIDRPREGPNVAAALAVFSIPQHLGPRHIHHPEAHPHSHGTRVSLDPREASERVKGFARHLGADLVGIAALEPQWVYARRGEIFYDNWEEWGREISLTHPYAIVFTMEMAWEMVRSAPHSPSVLESGVIYARGAAIATQLAAYIANLGYEATANHSRHYDLVLVPVAVDAGLGEVGRFGYLITDRFGPRVRLMAVTTDLPLNPDRPVDLGVEDFCRVCTKCARCCPSGSIPSDDLSEVNGSLRWKLNAETCFDYWGKIGTDCNVCMRVCPWGHPRTLPHRAITRMVKRNSLARRLFSPMDDLFYGRKPRPGAPPPWADFR